MRAAILLIPFAALAAYSAGAPPSDPYGDNVQAGDEGMTVTNFVDVPEADPENMAMDMDMPMDMNAAVDMNMMPGNYTASAPPPRPAWMGGNMWLVAGEEPGRAVWYFDPFGSDFGVTPHRVILRTDETPNRARRHNNTARVAEIDCAGETYRILNTVHYDDAGRRTEANERGDGSMIPAAPGSIEAVVVGEVCRHAAYQEAQRNAM